MDLSKLPKMSESPPPAPPPPAEPQPQPSPVSPRSTALAEAWISIAIGVLLLLMFPTSLQYGSSKLFHTTFAPFADPDRPYPAKCDFIEYTNGTRIYYRNLPNFWSDLAITAFALVLIVDGLVLLFARSRASVAAALLLTIIATAGNLIYLLTTYSTSGLPIVSALAVIFGIYIALAQWRLLVEMRVNAKNVQ